MAVPPDQEAARVLNELKDYASNPLNGSVMEDMFLSDLRQHTIRVRWSAEKGRFV